VRGIASAEASSKASGGDPETIGVLLVPRFSMMAFASAIEPLRCVNRMSGRELYRWRLYTGDGGPVAASNGIAIMPHAAVSEAESIELLLVCAGMDVHLYRDREVFSWLRRLARRGARLGALCTGSHILARCGLLDGHRCTIHWENIPGFVEEFPDIEVTTELFEFDRKRLTCSGGTAPLDMMLHLITRDHGHELAAAVSDQFIHDRIRGPNDHQRMALQSRLGVPDSKLISVISQMEANIEEPLPRGALAASVGLSTRQLERLFRKHLDSTPRHYYLGLRLGRARQLLNQTGMSVLAVALACGFVSASHFSKCYRELYGKTPREDRRTKAA
jgi:transcriptional regulator GlxA family with amidase domain